jgi:hypothetical protein
MAFDEVARVAVGELGGAAVGVGGTGLAVWPVGVGVAENFWGRGPEDCFVLEY